MAYPIIKDLDKETTTIENFDGRKRDLDSSLKNSMTSYQSLQSREESAITSVMKEFNLLFPQEATTLTAHIQALPFYEKFYQQLEHHDLPQYEKRFKDMLDRNVADSIRQFNGYLKDQDRRIEKSIQELNESLQQVDYGNGSHICLMAETNADVEVNEFKRMLQACMPNVGDPSPEELNRAYHRIRELIERFNTDPNWMKKVIDVRYWRTFAAKVLSANDEQLQYHADSSGMSGGQKAKLAYTILASAIAYQYGLQHTDSTQRTFRFVVVDEAFSKLDDDNARYAMQIFSQLGLQLMVVTPRDKLHAIESEVQSYVLVVNNEQGNNSQVYTLSDKDFHDYVRQYSSQSTQPQNQ